MFGSSLASLHGSDLLHLWTLEYERKLADLGESPIWFGRRRWRRRREMLRAEYHRVADLLVFGDADPDKILKARSR